MIHDVWISYNSFCWKLELGHIVLCSWWTRKFWHLYDDQILVHFTYQLINQKQRVQVVPRVDLLCKQMAGRQEICLKDDLWTMLGQIAGTDGREWPLLLWGRHCSMTTPHWPILDHWPLANRCHLRNTIILRAVSTLFCLWDDQRERDIRVDRHHATPSYLSMSIRPSARSHSKYFR